MRLAASTGMITARSEVRWFEDQIAIVIEDVDRHDRWGAEQDPGRDRAQADRNRLVRFGDRVVHDGNGERLDRLAGGERQHAGGGRVVQALAGGAVARGVRPRNRHQPVAEANDADAEIHAADHPLIRLYRVTAKGSDKPLATTEGKWVCCSPETIADFSATGYYFGRELNKTLNVPIGLVQAAVDGAPAEAWTMVKVLEADKELLSIAADYKEEVLCNPDRDRKYEEELARYEKSKHDLSMPTCYKDPGNLGYNLGWAEPDFNDSKWGAMKLPGFWENQVKGMDIDGSVWFRREVTIPASLAGKELALSLGPIADFDTAYFNNVKIGSTGEETADFWSRGRCYQIPAELVKPGKALLAVRVFDQFGPGGFGGKPEEMFLADVVGKEQPIPLDGPWNYKIELSLDPGKLRLASPPLGPADPTMPGGLFNGMIAPLIPYAIKGVAWYQGESNVPRAYQYRTLLPAMIRNWRVSWRQGDFPFLIVQLANIGKPVDKPCESAWAELREAQAMTAAKIPNCGIATAIDLGGERAVTPKGKQEVGRRLALAALKLVYGHLHLVSSGPTFNSFRFEGDKMRMHFDNVGSGLVAKDGELKWFFIAGEDREFHWAEAEIEGNTVLVRCPGVKRPTAVRYAWAQNPLGCNLYNKEGLPALPFRTDVWAGITSDANLGKELPSQQGFIKKMRTDW